MFRKTYFKTLFVLLFIVAPMIPDYRFTLVLFSGFTLYGFLHPMLKVQSNEQLTVKRLNQAKKVKTAKKLKSSKKVKTAKKPKNRKIGYGVYMFSHVFTVCLTYILFDAIGFSAAWPFFATMGVILAIVSKVKKYPTDPFNTHGAIRGFTQTTYYSLKIIGGGKADYRRKY